MRCCGCPQVLAHIRVKARTARPTDIDALYTLTHVVYAVNCWNALPTRAAELQWLLAPLEEAVKLLLHRLEHSDEEDADLLWDLDALAEKKPIHRPLSRPLFGMKGHIEFDLRYACTKGCA